MNIKKRILLFVPLMALLLQSCGGSGSSDAVRSETPPQLTVAIENDTAVEGDTGVNGSVSINKIRDADLTVNLSSSDTEKLTLPASVTIPEGDTSVSFGVTLLEDQDVLEIEKQIIVTASASGWTSGSDDLIVEDNDCNAALLAGGTYAFEVDADDIDDGCLGGMLEGDNIQAYIDTLTFPSVYLPADDYQIPYEMPSPGIELPFIGNIQGAISVDDNTGRLVIDVDVLDDVEIALSLLGFPGNYRLFLGVSFNGAIMCPGTDPDIIASFVMVIESATFVPEMPLYSLETPCEISVIMTGTLVP